MTDSAPQSRTEKPTTVVNADQAVWVQDRIRAAIETAQAIESCRSVGADLRAIDDALDGLVNGYYTRDNQSPEPQDGRGRT